MDWLVSGVDTTPLTETRCIWGVEVPGLLSQWGCLRGSIPRRSTHYRVCRMIDESVSLVNTSVNYAKNGASNLRTTRV